MFLLGLIYESEMSSKKEKTEYVDRLAHLGLNKTVPWSEGDGYMIRDFSSRNRW